MKPKRVSGILLHITSLPGPYGIGDFGPEAYRFVDFLRAADQRVWQILPLTPTENCSPYSGTSAFAGHPLLISLDKLVDIGLLTKDDLHLPDEYHFNDHYVEFNHVTKYKYQMLKKAYRNFEEQREQFTDLLEEFVAAENYWLDDYSLFMTIKELQNNEIWSRWPTELKYHQEHGLQIIRERDKDLVQYHVFLQFIFHQQWSDLKKYANQFEIQIIGDMPVYVDYTSADVWANAQLFQLDEKTLLPVVVSGFPPDDCSAEGQNWNMPIYDWENREVQPEIFKWWIKRLKKALQTVDIVRIDHFRGLESYWSIPVDENFVPLKPIYGHWEKAPGTEFFYAVEKALGADLRLIVEDLGELTEEIADLRDRFNLTGMRILQFGFGFYPDNIYRPHNYIQNCIAYTSTHDNPTVVGWWRHHAAYYEKEAFVNYTKTPDDYDQYADANEKLDVAICHLNDHIHWYFIKMLMASVANTAIVNFQDLLGLDDNARMNDPSLASNAGTDKPQNWSWRFIWSMLNENATRKLKLFTHMYYRDCHEGPITRE